MKKMICLLAVCLSSLGWAAGNSLYTKISEQTCRFNPEPEMGDLDAECVGAGGYKVHLTGNDGMDFLSLSYQGKNIAGYWSDQLGVTNFTGKTLEWRFQMRGNKKHFYALIYRVFFQKRSEPASQVTSKLAVIRLNGENSCVLGMIEFSPTMNAQARALADNFSADCQ